MQAQVSTYCASARPCFSLAVARLLPFTLPRPSHLSLQPYISSNTKMYESLPCVYWYLPSGAAGLTLLRFFALFLPIPCPISPSSPAKTLDPPPFPPDTSYPPSSQQTCLATPLSTCCSACCHSGTTKLPPSYVSFLPFIERRRPAISLQPLAPPFLPSPMKPPMLTHHTFGHPLPLRRFSTMDPECARPDSLETTRPELFSRTLSHPLSPRTSFHLYPCLAHPTTVAHYRIAHASSQSGAGRLAGLEGWMSRGGDGSSGGMKAAWARVAASDGVAAGHHFSTFDLRRLQPCFRTTTVFSRADGLTSALRDLTARSLDDPVTRESWSAWARRTLT